jgi:hypothetical protein
MTQSRDIMVDEDWRNHHFECCSWNDISVETSSLVTGTEADDSERAK